MFVPLLFAVLVGIARGIFSPSRPHGDFVENVVCRADGMDITLKSDLPIPRAGMWDMEVAGFPKCAGATKTDVGGGYTFTISYANKDWCGVEPKSLFTPSWVSTAAVTLLLIDDNGTRIADSISCVYNTRFEASVLSFSGNVKSGQLRQYEGSLSEDGADVEETVQSGNAITMDFFDETGRALQERNVKLGDPVLFKIDVSENKQVSKVMPELCYFSSSSDPSEKPLDGQTLTFVKHSCFNEKNGMVRAFLPKMQRNLNGTSYEMMFPAFYFTDFGQSLFVHCTLLACIGSQTLCDPKPMCFGTERRAKREADDFQPFTDDGRLTRELTLTKYIIVDDKRKARQPEVPSVERATAAFFDGTICMQTPHFSALVGSFLMSLMILLVCVSCMGGRLVKLRSAHKREEKQRMQILAAHLYPTQPPAYPTATTLSASLASLPTITAF